MLDHLKAEGQRGGPLKNRLSVYVLGLLVLGGVFFYLASSPKEKGAETLPEARPVPAATAEAKHRIDRNRLPQADDTTTWSAWNAPALDYLLSRADEDFADEATRVDLAALDAQPYEKAAGEVVETEGTIEAMGQEETSMSPGGVSTFRLWWVLLEDDAGHRAIILKRGLASDPGEGKPEEALYYVTEYLAKGDHVLVRGIYMQRRTGTFGDAIVRTPIPVLVATPPEAAFRKLPKPAVAVGDLDEADWDEIHDRYLKETQYLADDALFQALQWTKQQGVAKLQKAVLSGSLPSRAWDRDLFDRWGEEVEIVDPHKPRPLTESLRGHVFHTTGLVGAYGRIGWTSVPRKGSAWGIDTYYILDLTSDYWGNRDIRMISAFPLSAYKNLKGGVADHEHVRVYGVFVKNYTYTTKQMRNGEEAVLTMPLFVVLDIEPILPGGGSYRVVVWIISGLIVLLGIAFWLVFVRGESRESERMDAYRRSLRKRIREREGSPLAGMSHHGTVEGGEPPAEGGPPSPPEPEA